MLTVGSVDVLQAEVVERTRMMIDRLVGAVAHTKKHKSVLKHNAVPMCHISS